MKISGFIYETTNLVTGMKYIGQHTRYGSIEDPDDSWYLGSGTLLREAISSYGEVNFSRVILEECDSRETLNAAEIRWIRERNAIADPTYYNIAEGGGGSWFTDKGRARMSEAGKAKFRDPEKRAKYCKPHTVTQAMYDAARRRALSHIGIPVEDPEITRLRMTGSGNPMYGKEFSVTHRSKISKSLSGVPKSDSHRRATADANIGMRVLHHGTVVRRVKGETINQLLSEGWSFGYTKKEVL